MKRIRIIGIVAVMALIAACSPTADPPATTSAAPGTTTPSSPDTTAPPTGSDNPFEDYGETLDADMSLIARALGPVTPSDEASWNIILAAVARANQNLDEATITKALECYNNQECSTGNSGDLVMGYADGGGKGVNVWRAVSRMEAILQALTYDEIGTIVTREANFAEDTNVPINDIRFLITRGVDFIVGYPDTGTNLSDVILDAKAAGIPYFPFSAGWVGLPDQENALIPGTDYPTVVGEQLCDLGTSFAKTLNDNLDDDGKVALLGGSTNNALTLGWQRCFVDELSSSLNLVNPPADRNTTAGDTWWFYLAIPGVIEGILGPHRPINGWAYEYADGFYYGLDVFEQLDAPWENVTLALRTDEQRMFCHWRDANEPTYKIFYSAGGNFQSRVAVTAAMLHNKGFTPPAEIVVPHVMRQVTAADCDENRAHDEVSGTSLVPDTVLRQMFSN